MSYFRWRPYVPVAVRRENAERIVRSTRRAGGRMNPVRIEGRKIATTFWGEAWCRNLEAFSDYANRLPRGRAYVRNGSVIDLLIAEGRVSASVMGSSLYSIEIGIAPLPPKRWEAIQRECAGKIDSVIELLQGKLSNGVMGVVTKRGEGLFPTPKEITLNCSCPDWAQLCKHLAAVLYGVGARLDQEPELLFLLRKVDKLDLISQAGSVSFMKESVAGGLSPESLSGIFGIDIDNDNAVKASSVQDGKPASAKKRTSRRPAPKPAPKRPRKPVPKTAAPTITTRELVALGVPTSARDSWLLEGVLLKTERRGVYKTTPQTKDRVAIYQSWRQAPQNAGVKTRGPRRSPAPPRRR